MRRLPVFILVDTSGSMKGEPIEATKTGLECMVASLRSDPYALETVWISVITYDREAKELCPLTPLEDFKLPDIVTPQSGPTHMGMGLELLWNRLYNEVRLAGDGETRGDWRPLVFMMTDGKPSDLYIFDEIAPKIKGYPFGAFIACAAGPKADPEPLRRLTDQVVQMDTMDGPAFQALFAWVSASVTRTSSSLGAVEPEDLVNQLPPPPPTINLVGQ